MSASGVVVGELAAEQQHRAQHPDPGADQYRQDLYNAQQEAEMVDSADLYEQDLDWNLPLATEFGVER